MSVSYKTDVKVQLHLFLFLLLGDSVWLKSRPEFSTSGKEPFIRSTGDLCSRSGLDVCEKEKNPLPSQGFKLRTVQTLAIQQICEFLFSSPLGHQLDSDSRPPLTGLHDYTCWTQHTPQESSVRGIGSQQRPLPDNTQHSQDTDKHAVRWDSNPQFQQARGCRPTPQTARPLRWAVLFYGETQILQANPIRRDRRLQINPAFV